MIHCPFGCPETTGGVIHHADCPNYRGMCFNKIESCPSCAVKDAEIARLTDQLEAVTRERNALLAKQSAWWANNNTLIQQMQRLRAQLDGTAEQSP